MTELLHDAVFAVAGPAAAVAAAALVGLAGAGVLVGRGLARSASMVTGGAR